MAAIEYGVMRVMYVPANTGPDIVQTHLIANGFDINDAIEVSCALDEDDNPNELCGCFFMQTLGMGSC